MNGDGIGDLAGIRSHLEYLHDLGVDAIWLSPWYPSPMADAGYDVADYRDIDPVFGTLAEAEALIAEAHAVGIRTIVDIVPNHTSTAHVWFAEALAGGPMRDRFYFRAGRDGRPPNNWESIFGGPAWTQVADDQWYLHLFDSGQPDLNWDHPAVRAEFDDILRFWFDRGVDGIRIDSAAMVAKDPALPDFDPLMPPDPHPWIDREALHELYRGWRRIADSYHPSRALIGEVWLPDPQRFVRYLRPDELHTAFNFDFLGCPWDAKALRRCIDETLTTHAAVGAPATWVLSNHDVTRHVTRYGRTDTGFSHDLRQARHQLPTDLALGTRRARAAALLTLALPGSVYVYQGEELGLPEVEDIAAADRQDPIFLRSAGTDPGRDGCRVPLPWSGSAPPYGFGGTGWLPQPDDWAERTVATQIADDQSMLNLYRRALRLRRALPGLGDGPSEWQDSADDVLAFDRPHGFTCVVNLSARPVAVPAGTVLIASTPIIDGVLPPDAAVWVSTAL
ncbi:alpha-amylase family glycosyl hydrolase [Dactylosporangium sp. NPDC000244]|uniref:alpha-amylase family glycosyl hydrolase n=1 Tax=Dactylosporangium sp. NPDC000244 TaxID=3154365 RepID=UPI003318FDF3